MLTRTIVTGLWLGLAAAGCGGNKGSTTTSSPTAATPTATPTPVPISVAMTLSVAAPSTASDVTIAAKAGLKTSSTRSCRSRTGAARTTTTGSISPT